LLEGLEVSIINKSNLERTLRFDSEFYSKNNSVIQDIINKHETAKISDLTYVSDGNHMSISDRFTEKGIPYYRGQDIHNFFIEQSDPICIDEEAYNLPTMKRSHLKKGDVLLSIVGTIGGVSLVSKENPATCNCKLAILRPNHIDGFYLSVFLQSEFGQNQIKKFTRGAVQKGLILEDMDQIFVPVLSLEFQNRIHSLVDLAYKKLDSSKKIYKSSENVLLEIIGLNNFEPSRESINIKSFKDSFLNFERLDAEYYQPKYDQTVNQITLQNHDKLKNLVEIKKSIEPGSSNYSDEGIPFLRVSDYNKFQIDEPEKKVSLQFYEENTKTINNLMPKKDTILFSKDGTVGIAHMLREDKEMITSGAILHLKVKDKEQLIPQYLTLVLNSEVVQLQAERDAGGSIILHWRVNQIENVVIPLIEYKKQREIAELVEESFLLREQSEYLLKVAKRAVEIAIEQDEDAAIDFINQNNK